MPSVSIAVDICTVSPYNQLCASGNSDTHKGLKALYQDDDVSGVSASVVPKIKRILAAVEFADDLSQLITPGWRVHTLKGDRRGVYSITVTGNWRITFRLEESIATDIDFEDYH